MTNTPAPQYRRYTVRVAVAGQREAVEIATAATKGEAARIAFRRIRKQGMSPLNVVDCH